jgi:nucleoside-diphosphate-sugar epimerase
MLTHLHSSPLMPARVVVLGARGFVAASVLGRLSAAGVSVLGLSASDLDLTAADAGSRLAAMLREDDALVFVSALTPDRGRDIATLMKNLQMGQAVSAALAGRPCAHVVYVSTDAVYPDADSLVRESSRAEPSGFHGTMHLVRERMLLETLRPTATPLARLRPSLLYGAADTHNGYGPNRFARDAVAGGPIALFGGGEEQRDHVAVDDVADLVVRVLARRSAGVLNIATGRSMSFAAMAELARQAVNRPVEIVPSPRANLVTHRHFDITALVTAFPDFRFTAPEDGVARMVHVLAAKP